MIYILIGEIKVKNIKWLFFDVGSTLVDESKVYQDRMRKIAEIANVEYKYVYDTAIEFYKENKKGDLEIVKMLNVELPNWKHEYEMLYNDTKICLKTLSKKYKIGIIANQTFGTEKRLENLGILQYIDLVIASAEEGVAKPDRRIFEIALNRANCIPERSVMIGDRIDNDIIPAKEIGMKTIWIKRGFGKYWSISNENERADYEVGSLKEILTAL
jgi:8-oxo-dGTP diphosphatase